MAAASPEADFNPGKALLDSAARGAMARSRVRRHHAVTRQYEYRYSRKFSDYYLH